MPYTIEKLKGEEVASHPGKLYKLIEDGYESMPLDHHATKLEAQKSMLEWQARDNLEEAIGNFYAEMEANYSDILDEDEIKLMISAY